jgi:hypothetical protein
MEKILKENYQLMMVSGFKKFMGWNFGSLDPKFRV